MGRSVVHLLLIPTIVTAMTTTLSSSIEDETVTRKLIAKEQNPTAFTTKPSERKSVRLTYTEKVDSNERPTYASKGDVQSEDNLTDDKVIKDKLVSLLLSSKKDIVKRMKKIDSIHDVYKSEKLYRIGYLVSFVNKLYKKLLSSYANIEANKYKWNVLKILNAFNEVKNSNDFLKEMLRLMQAVLTARHKLNRQQVTLRQPLDCGEKYFLPFSKRNYHTDKGYAITTTNAISWSYYDENIGN